MEKQLPEKYAKHESQSRMNRDWRTSTKTVQTQTFTRHESANVLWQTNIHRRFRSCDGKNNNKPSTKIPQPTFSNEDHCAVAAMEELGIITPGSIMIRRNDVTSEEMSPLAQAHKSGTHRLEFANKTSL